MNPIETLESTFPAIKTTDTFQKWISAKQSKFFISVCKLSHKTKYTSDTQQTVYVGTIGQYDIAIYISPLNDAGSITIKNMSIINDNHNSEKQKELEELQAKLLKFEQSLSDILKLDDATPHKQLFVDGAQGMIDELKRKISSYQ